MGGLTWQPAFSSSLHQVQFCIHKAQYVYRKDSAQSQGIHTEIMVRGESSGETRQSLPVRLFCVLGRHFSQGCAHATPRECMRGRHSVFLFRESFFADTAFLSMDCLD